MTQFTETPAASRRLPLISAGVVLLAVVAGLLLALVLSRAPQAAAGDPSPTASPTPVASPSISPVVSPSPSAAPSATPKASDTPVARPAEPSQAAREMPVPSEEPGPTPVVQAPKGVLPPGAVGRVAVDALRVRERPTTDAAEVGMLSRDALVLLGYSLHYEGFGPIEADGFTWYPVSSIGATELPEPGGAPLEADLNGWAAVAHGTDPFVELVAPRCVEGDVDLALLQSLTEWERLACYGNRSITIEGTLGCGGCGGVYAGTFEPAWLATPMNFEFLSVEPQERIGPFRLRFAPDGPERPQEPGVAPILRVTGHFDDAAAADCVVATLGNGNEPINDTVAELYCRSQFVVDSYEILGTDDDFPFS